MSSNGNPSEPPNYRSKVLVAGYRKSGKTSTQKVVFDHLIPKETFFLPKTQVIEPRNLNTIIPIRLLDAPEDLLTSPSELEQLIPDLQAIVFVIDINDQWFNAVTQFGDLMATCAEFNKPLIVHVFIHKMETISHENKMSKFNDLQKRMNDELNDLELFEVKPIFHSTSIYDHTIYQAWSEVVTSLIPEFILGGYDNLINSLHINSGTKYAFLFDSKSCLRISSNQDVHEAMTFSLSCEYLKLLGTMSQVVGTGLRNGHEDNLYSCQLELTETLVSYWRITDTLCLIAGFAHDRWHELRGTIEYNVLVYRDGLLQILEAVEEDRKNNVTS